MNYDLFISPAHVERDFASAVSSGRVSSGRGTGQAAHGRAASDVAGLPQGEQAQNLSRTEEVANTVAGLNDVLDQANVGLRYRVDDTTGDLVVSLVNRDSGETVRQIPPDQILHMRQRLQELMGVLFDATV